MEYDEVAESWAYLRVRNWEDYDYDKDEPAERVDVGTREYPLPEH